MGNIMRFLPGAAMTAGGVATGDPMLLAGGMSSMAGQGAGMLNKQSPDQQLTSAFSNNPSLSSLNPSMVMGTGPGSPPLGNASVANWGNIADAATPLIGLGTQGIGRLLGGGQQPQPPAATQAPQLQPPAPAAPPPMPVGPSGANPMGALAAYQSFLSRMG
jgi:hypothetical protein